MTARDVTLARFPFTVRKALGRVSPPDRKSPVVALSPSRDLQNLETGDLTSPPIDSLLVTFTQ